MGTIIEGNFLFKKELIIAGEFAKDFSLPSNLGGEWQLSDNIGKVVVLLFYPQNATLVCTKHLCSLRDNWKDYLETNALVVGVSHGSIQEHQDFARKYRLPMPLLVDEERRITKTFGQHPWLPINMCRSIVVIDAKGIIRSKKVMFRGFHPTDYSILASIYEAKTDAAQEKFQEILKKHKQKKVGLFRRN